MMTSANSVETSRRFFSVEEANNTLPLVRVIVSDIVRQWQVVSDLEQRLYPVLTDRQSDESDPYSEELVQSVADLEAEQEKFRAYLEELEKLGVELKGAHNGLCDFPSLKDGREICLCWKLGEPEVRFWHEVHTGYAGRQPLAASGKRPKASKAD